MQEFYILAGIGIAGFGFFTGVAFLVHGFRFTGDKHYHYYGESGEER